MNRCINARLYDGAWFHQSNPVSGPEPVWFNATRLNQQCYEIKTLGQGAVAWKWPVSWLPVKFYLSGVLQGNWSSGFCVKCWTTPAGGHRRLFSSVLISELLQVLPLGIISPPSRFRVKQVKFRSTCFPFDSCCHTRNKQLLRKEVCCFLLLWKLNHNACEKKKSFRLWNLIQFWVFPQSTSSIKRHNSSHAGVSHALPGRGGGILPLKLIRWHFGQRDPAVASAKWVHIMASYENKCCHFHSCLTHCYLLYHGNCENACPRLSWAVHILFQWCNIRPTTLYFTITWSSRWNAAEIFSPLAFGFLLN